MLGGQDVTPVRGLDGARAARTSPSEEASVLEAEPVQASTVTGVTQFAAQRLQVLSQPAFGRTKPF